MASSKKSPLADALRSARRTPLENLTVRVSSDERRQLEALMRHMGARSVGEVLRFAARRLFEESGLKL